MRRLVALAVAAIWLVTLGHGAAVVAAVDEPELVWCAQAGGPPPVVNKDDSDPLFSFDRDHSVRLVGAALGGRPVLSPATRAPNLVSRRPSGHSRRILHHRASPSRDGESA